MTAADFQANRAIEVVPSRIANAAATGEAEALRRLARGETIGEGDIAGAVAFVKGQNDGSDFRVITLLRALYAYEHALSVEVRAAIKDMLLGFRYWMDEPGVSPMFHTSENHQILFAAAELLAGQRFPSEKFADGRTGAEHAAAARERSLFWLGQRWRFGFSEWNSHYYGEDAAALGNLIDFAADEEVVRKARIVLDLLMFDMASQSFRGKFIATSGRLYENNKKIGDAGIDRIMRHAFFSPEGNSGQPGIDINFLLSGYDAPPVLKAIANDDADVIIRSSFGRDLDELAYDASLTTTDRKIMALWGMSAFTNPQAITLSVQYSRDHGLFANPYLAPLKRLNYRVLTTTGALPLISRALDLPANGIALERANTYTYRTRDYAMSTTQAHRPGGFGNQQHIFGITLDDGVTLFHTHPAVLAGDPPPNGNAPGYWTGTGFLPLSCQEGALNLSLYRLPAHPGFGRRYLLPYTHLYAPLSRFSRVMQEESRLFLQYKDALIAVLSASPLRVAGPDELVQDGQTTFWITEASSIRTESFEAFADRIRASTVRFDGQRVVYTSGGRSLSASWKDGCGMDGLPLRTAYDRHSSRYAQVQREPGEIRIAFGGHGLLLNFDRMTRRFE